MKTSVILIIISILTFSCGKKEKWPEKDKFGHKIYYRDLDYCKNMGSNRPKESVIIIDTACINQKERAINDIKNNKLTYYTTWAPHEIELREALKKYDISLKCTLKSTCITSRFRSHCYEVEMNNELYERYGQEFFISLWNNTLEQHIKEFPNETFNEDGKILKLKDNYKFLLKTAW